MPPSYSARFIPRSGPAGWNKFGLLLPSWWGPLSEEKTKRVVVDPVFFQSRQQSSNVTIQT
jgi:hypothetical protein